MCCLFFFPDQEVKFKNTWKKACSLFKVKSSWSPEPLGTGAENDISLWIAFTYFLHIVHIHLNELKKYQCNEGKQKWWTLKKFWGFKCFEVYNIIFLQWFFKKRWDNHCCKKENFLRTNIYGVSLTVKISFCNIG